MPSHLLRNARVIFATMAICLVMLAGLAMPHAASAETLGNQSGPSVGQQFCSLLGGTKVPDGIPEESGTFRTITCLLADRETMVECTITTGGRLNICERRP